MKFCRKFLVFGVIVTLFSCEKETVASESVKVTQTRPVNKAQLEADALKVSGFLIYDDGTESTFDILNSKDIVLYNVITGGGSAKKPAHQLKLVFTGNLDGLYAQIEEYGSKEFSEKFPAKSRVHEIIMKDIGCQSIYLVVRDDHTNIYDNSIPFGCGN